MKIKKNRIFNMFIMGLLIISFSCESIKKNKTNEYIGTDTIFTYDILNKWLKIGLNQNEVIKQLGAPLIKGNDEYWGATGTYVQQWDYDQRGIILNMESEIEGGNKKVMMIRIKAPSALKTINGISIGTDVSQIESKYGDKINKEFSTKESIVVGSVYGGVIFTLDNEKVTEIFIGEAAE